MRKKSKEIKQFIAVLLTSAVIATYVVPSYADETEVADDTLQTEVVDNSAETEPTPEPAVEPVLQPQPTDVPQDTMAPAQEGDEAGAGTEAAPTEVPVTEPTEIPEVTPEVSDIPVSTEAPAETEVPKELPTGTPEEQIPETEPAMTPESEVPISSATPESVPDVTPAILPESTPTALPEEEPTVTPTASPTVMPEEPSATPVATQTPSVSPSPMASVTPTASVAPSVTPSASPSATPTASPTATPVIVPEDAYEEPVVTFICIDENENVLYQTKESPVFEDRLDLRGTEKVPFSVEGYTYINAVLDDTILVTLVKTEKEAEAVLPAIAEDAESTDSLAEEDALTKTITVWSYITETGEEVVIEEDTVITLNYEEEKMVVSVDATCVDTFGDEIGGEYSHMELPEFTNDMLILDNPDIPPVEKVQVRSGLFKVTKYTYAHATIDNEVVKAMKRTLISKTQNAEEKEYIYAYTTDGAEWKEIQKDTTVKFVYSDGKKSTYTYEDSYVSVVATLQHANAIPDDARFVVTPVTPESDGYNYDAYMEALNGSAEAMAEKKEAYTAENTLLYDIAFLAPATDENGNVIEGETVEYQPAEGMVNISIVFKQKQLTEEIAAESAQEVSVVHLPLQDSVKEENLTTAEATDITAADVKVEVIDNASVAISGNGNEQISFSAETFSVYSVSAASEEVKDFTTTDTFVDNGGQYTLEYLLNHFQVVALGDVTMDNHCMGALLIKGNLSGTATGFADDVNTAKTVSSYIGGSVKGFAGRYATRINNTDIAPLYLGSANDVTQQISGEDIYYVVNGSNLYVPKDSTGKVSNPVYITDNYVDWTAVSTALTTQSDYLASVCTKGGVEGPVGGQNALTIRAGEYVTIEDLTGIKAINIVGDMTEAVNTVINFNTSGTVNLPNIMFNGNQPEQKEVGGGTSVVWNLPNASEVILPPQTWAGHIVAPNAHVNKTEGNYNGGIICKTAYIYAEGHVYGYNSDTVTPSASYTLTANKTVAGQTPAAGQKFNFKVDKLGSYTYNGQEQYVWTSVLDAQNNGGSIVFDTISCDKAATSWYRIYEDQTSVDGYVLSTTQYVAKVVVSGTDSLSTDITYYKVTGSDTAVIAPADLITGSGINEGKLTAISGSSQAVFDNTETATLSKTVTKKWEDSNNYYKTRPDSISVQLLANGVASGDAVVLNAGNNWSYTWENLPGSADGNKIVYTVQEITEVKGYTTAYSGDTFTITNTLKTVDVSGSKTWSGENPNYIARPDSITVRVMNGNTEVTSATVSADQNGEWKYSFTGLPACDKDGNTINYSVKEDAVPGYSTSVNGYNITNTLTDKVTISGSKIWNDGSNADNKRPSEVTIELKNGGTVIDSKTITGNGDSWSYSFTDLPKYDKYGNQITYTVAERVVPSGYSAQVDGYDITNTYTPETVSKTVTKKWDDGNNKYDTRPASITVQLKADGEDCTVGDASVEMNASMNWTYTWNNLPKYKNGKEIVYTVEESVSVTGYTTSYSGDTFTITNTLDTVDIAGNKTWSGEHAYSTRPDSITVLVMNGSLEVARKTVTAGNDGNWEYSFTGLPKYDKTTGNLITYTIDEVEVKGYTKEINGNNLVNTLSDTVDISGSKVWDDGEDADGKRPASVTIQLMNGNTVVESKNVTGTGNSWEFSFTGLPKYDQNGAEINYTIAENTLNLPEGYEAVISGDMNNGYTVTNTYTPEVTSKTVTKVWVDSNNAYQTRPDSITVQLKANGQAQGEAVTITANENWSYTWNDLPKYKSGQEITYTVVENEVKGYTTSYSAKDLTITNTLITTEVSGSKEWVDKDNEYNLRPASITIRVSSSNGKVNLTQTVSESSNWEWSFTGLPKYDSDGTELTYTIAEDTVNGYAMTVSGYDVTNTVILVPITVTKVWDDNDNEHNNRTESVTVQLMKNGTEKVGESQILSEDNNWTCTYNNLPKYNADGSEVAYSVVETDVPSGYTYGVTGSVADGFTVTNTYNPDHVTRTVTKVWEDGNNAYKTRPASIEVQLWAGEEVYDAVTLNAANNWTYTWSDLPDMLDGKDAVYTVKEVAVPHGYEQNIVTLNDTFTITNTLQTVDVEGEKTWIDGNNALNTRPEKIVISVMNGEDVVVSKEVNASDKWAWSFTGLPKYDDTTGDEIAYTIKEEAVEGYDTSCFGYDVTNTILQDTVTISGIKTWIAPVGTEYPQVTIKLLKDGEAFKTATLSDGATTYAFENLDKYDLTEKKDGHEYVYTVEEVAVDGYTCEKDGYDFTNTINQQKITISGEKNWIAPTGTEHPEVTVKLLKDGKEFKTATLPNGTTTYTFADLDKYDLTEKKDGHQYVYEVEEVPVEGYTGVQDGYDFTNIIEQELITIEGTKTWRAPEGTDYPDVTIELWRDGEYHTKTVIPGGSKTYSFTGLPKYDLTDGHVYNYVVQEISVDGYTSVKDGNDFTNTISQDKVNINGTKTWRAPAGTEYPDITINLLRNGEKADSVILKNGETEYSFTDLPKYDLNTGKPYTYTVSEEPVEGYTTTRTGNHFVNTINQQKITISGTKTWVDPKDTIHEDITIRLIRNDGVEAGRVVLKNGKTEYSFTDLDMYDLSTGLAYTYSIKEDVVEGYQTTYDGYNVTNTIEQEIISVGGTKEWIVPDSVTEFPPITIRLYRDNVLYATKSLANGATSYRFDNLEKYADDGHIYNYTVTEDAVDGYSSAQNGYDFVNTIHQKYTSVSGTKTWIAPKGITVPDITINLLRDGVEVKEVTLSAGDTKYAFENLEVYDLTDGHEYVYTVSEDALADYETTITGNNITNKIKQEKITVGGTKTWLDAEGNEQPIDTVHPVVTIQLLRDGSVVQTTELASGESAYSFDNLDKYDPDTGYEYQYSVQEVPITGYISSQSGFDFTNRVSDDKVNVSGIKTWIAPTGVTHPTIIIRLWQNGTEIDHKELAHGTTTYSFENLPRYDDGGIEYIYTVTEDSVEGYETEQEGFNFKNTISQEEIIISGTKTWLDPDGTVHPAITVNLLKDGVKIDGRELSNGQDTYEFKNLDRYDINTGKEYVYTIEEEHVAGYNGKVDGYNITNTIEQQKTSVSGNKKWIVPEGTECPAITVVLNRNGEPVDSKVLPSGITTYSFEELDKYDLSTGKVYKYSVTEEPVPGYTGTVNGYTITNTIKQEYLDITGTKTWIAPDGTQHPTITVKLMRDGNLNKKVELTNGNTEYSFTDLPKYDLTDGHVYVYKVEEEPVEGYTTTYDGHNIINTINQEKISISGTKTWVAPEGTEHPEITIHLLKDGVKVDKVTLQNGTTSYSFTDLDCYDLTESKDGHKYVYTLEEDSVEGYTSTQSGNNFINTYIQPEATPTATPTATPSATPEATPSATPEVTPGATPTATPSATPKVTPSATPEATPSATPKVTPGATPKVTPSATPKATPGATPKVTPTPSAAPTEAPTVAPDNSGGETPAPTAEPTSAPTAAPTPVITPTPAPTGTPAVEPTPTPEGNRITEIPGDDGPGDRPDNDRREPAEEEERPSEPIIMKPNRVQEKGVKGAVRGARRGLELAVLGRRRRPVTGDSLALLLWIMALSVAMGTSITSTIMMIYDEDAKKKRRIR